MNLSPQKELIVSILRDLQWHCGREWLNQVKDDRKRIGELNEGHMKEKGYEIVGEPCKGSICRIAGCPLYKRRAIPLQSNHKPATAVLPPKHTSSQDYLKRSAEMVRLFDSGKSAEEVFAV